MIVKLAYSSRVCCVVSSGRRPSENRRGNACSGRHLQEQSTQRTNRHTCHVTRRSGRTISSLSGSALNILYHCKFQRVVLGLLHVLSFCFFKGGRCCTCHDCLCCCSFATAVASTLACDVGTIVALASIVAAAVTSVATTVPRDRPGGASCRTPWSRRRHRGPQASLCPPVFAETSANRLADVFACLCGQYQ